MKGKVGLLINPQKPQALELGKRLLRWGSENGVTFLAPPHEAAVLGVPGVSDEEWKNQAEFAVVLGGDGTFLRAARYVLGKDIPLYGINVGRLGFLASGDPNQAEENIQTILQGRFSTQKRRLLKGTITRGGSMVHEVYALNDLVVTKGAFARVITLQISVGDRPLSLMTGDGLILSTPTGSTGYALSAGGPIVPPHVPCMLLVPICAHTLYARAMVFGDEDTIQVVPRGDHRDMMLTQDGQLGYELLPGDCISVSLSREKWVSMILLQDKDYYDLLLEKFQWGQNLAE